MCAERVAIYAAASQHPDKKIVKMAVVAHKKNHKDLVAAASCGACRQVMLEFELRQKSPLQIVFLGGSNQWIICESSSSLLPFGFSKDNLIG
jgi:cytidine deaminase